MRRRLGRISRTGRAALVLLAWLPLSAAAPLRGEPAAARASVPSLLLQPLVENAIKYAVSPQEEGARISLTAQVLGNRLRLTVADTGPGLQGRPLIQRRYENRGGGDTVSTGVGLANIRDRLAQTYGDDHRFEIVTPPEGGFTVIIEVPHEVYREPEAAREASSKPPAAPAVTNEPGERALGTQA